MSSKLKFKPKARLLLQLGDQLIRNESVALLEIIKNSYDADARNVQVSMKNLEEPDKGEIIIEDDGIGMDSDIIENVWMQPGSDYKLKIIEKLDGDTKTNKRAPIGEKGIGRFGAHKLGYKIELVSKKKNKKEVVLNIDWRDFEKDDLLENVRVTLTERDTPLHFKSDKTGTRIVITVLKKSWDRGTVRELHRAVTSLNSPFERLDNFSVRFSIDNQEWLKGLLKFEDYQKHALYYAEAIIEGNEIKKLQYEFRPWDTMSKLKIRKEILKNIRMVQNVYDKMAGKKRLVDINLADHKIGQIRIKLLIFDRSSKILSLGVTDKKGLQEYLNVNGGIRVFRSGVRVYDYGEPDNDWLELDIKRVNQPGETISNNLIIGAVDIDRLASKDLIEKTNREGFIEGEAYSEFKNAVCFTLDSILTQRNIDKDKVRRLYSPASVNQPVVGHLKDLQEKIKEKVVNKELREDLLKSIKSIEADYKTISEIYTRSSSAGLSLSIVIHEIIHMIEELAAAIKKTSADSHIKNLISSLQRTVGDYAGVIRQSHKSKEDLVELIDQAFSNIHFRLKAHDIEIIKQYKNKKKFTSDIKCAPNLVVSTIINIVDNSMWWQNYARTKHKKVFVDLVEDPKGYLSILIADNGPGFSIPPEEAIKPFISNKPGGMGLGLHLAHEVMNAQKGVLLFPDEGDYEMPDEFQKGAQLLLAFKR